MITPKGLHILERFITKNGISADHTLRLFAQQPICMKLLHLERRSADDEVIVTRSVIDVLWRRFIGREPNLSTLSDDDVESLTRSRWYATSAVIPGEEIDRSQGIILRKRIDQKKAGGGGNGASEEYTFLASMAVDWLLDFSTSVGPDEAAELAAQFVRYGFIQLHSDTGRMKEMDFVATVRAGGAGGGAGAIMVSRAPARFRDHFSTVHDLLVAPLRARADARAFARSKKPNSESPPRQSTNSPEKEWPPLDGKDTPHSSRPTRHRPILQRRYPKSTFTHLTRHTRLPGHLIRPRTTVVLPLPLQGHQFEGRHCKNGSRAISTR